MKKVFVSIIILFLVLTGVGQTTRITGVVVDGSGKQPLPGASIRVPNTHLGASSGKNGEFEIVVNTKDEIILVCSYIGYANDTIHVKAGAEVTFEMFPSAILADEVIIRATKQYESAPKNYSDINAEAIKSLQYGQDMSQIIETTPSAVSSSDAGTGVGYTGIRIRGTDLNRINVTINGVPYNDPESHGVFWVDVPDLSSVLENIQIQRGVGASSNGAASFGASINLQTGKLRTQPFTEISALGGSFNTYSTTLRFGTGLLSNNWAVDGRFSYQHSDGYIDRAFADLKSGYLSGGYYGGKSIVRFLWMSGIEKTYQAWNGIPSVRLNNDMAGMQRYADHGLYTQQQVDEMLASGSRTYNLYTYGNETDNYQQDHYHLSYTQQVNSKSSFSATAFLIRGVGYYEQFKQDESLSDYLLPNLIIGNDTISHSDLIRRKFLDNYFYGAIANYFWDNQKNLKLTLGGGLNRYDGDHYGNIVWMQYAGSAEINHQYYLNNGSKNDYNAFAKMQWLASKNLSVFADVQYRDVRFDAVGMEDNMDSISVKKTFGFFNPKIGLVFNYKKSEFYFFSGIGHREPNRDNLVAADESNKPEAETLYDFEIGHTLYGKKLKFNSNLYYMYYDNQLILTGAINDVGAAIFTNIDRSYRYGIELSADYLLSKKISFTGNIAFSQNIIPSYTAFVDDWDTWGQRTEKYDNAPISFSPSVVYGSRLNYKPFKQMKISLDSKLVSRQYIDNSGSESRSLDPYMVHHLRFEYSIKPRFADEIVFRLSVNNIFGEKYETNAWIYRYYLGGEHYTMDGYFPQAGRNIMGGISIKF